MNRNKVTPALIDSQLSEHIIQLAATSYSDTRNKKLRYHVVSGNYEVSVWESQRDTASQMYTRIRVEQLLTQDQNEAINYYNNL